MESLADSTCQNTVEPPIMDPLKADNLSIKDRDLVTDCYRIPDSGHALCSKMTSLHSNLPIIKYKSPATPIKRLSLFLHVILITQSLLHI